jgi:HlyD family secretion protein
MPEPSSSAPAGAAANRLFRKAALDRLSSPEQLDFLIELDKPRDWVAFVVLATLVVVAAAWSVIGEVPERIKGQGILLTSGGSLVEAIALGEGTLSDVLVPVGTWVEKGQIIAHVVQPAKRQQLADAMAVVAEQRLHLDNLKQQSVPRLKALEESLSARKTMLDVRISDATSRADVLTRETEKDAALFERHLITWQQLNSNRQALAEAKQAILDARSQILQLDSDAIAQKHSFDRDIATSRDRLADAERQKTQIETQLRQQEDITSPAGGRVTEISAVVGTHVGAGQRLIGIESGATGLELVLYVPSNDGKQVKVGMNVQVVPSTIRREEYGTLKGTIAEVSEFPVTAEALQATLHNSQMVQTFSSGGAPFATRVKLTLDPSTFSGFAWSGGSGPQLKLSSGSFANGEVTVSVRRPISYVIPWLRKTTGLMG